MARIHSRKKGKSSSTKPYKTESPDWVPLSPAEIEKMIMKLANEGHSTSMIGMKLRDQYGVPNIKLCTGKSISEIIADKGDKQQLPEDLSNLMRTAVSIDEHISENPKDLHNIRALALTEAKIRRLMKYYKRRGVLPPEWKYDLKSAKLLVE
jgi:small subunit ribosomal protein S15